MRNLLLTLACSALLFAEGPAASEWAWKMASPFGELNAKAVMTIEGDKLTGAFWLDDSRKLEIQNGKFEDGKVTFTLKRERPSGGTMTYEMTGTIKGDAIEGSAKAVEMGATQAWSAKRK
ncbi:MAG: hypothetical protein FJW36_06150 [Acidobacteria bacterium]|nr:hypothetical protein [Acidobacteriota bacterium]